MTNPIYQEEGDSNKSQHSELVRPKSELFLPMSPFQIRMKNLPIHPHNLVNTPDYQKGLNEYRRLLENNFEYQLYLKEMMKLLPIWLKARLMSGSGLLMADTLRCYMQEYAHRFKSYGVTSLPSSFNIVEAFMFLHEKFLMFDLREEREHLLTLDDYFYWYSNVGFTLDPKILLSGMKEGLIYSFDMADTSFGYRIETNESSIVIAGVSLVRHAHEVSCILVAGENPPNPSDEEIVEFSKSDIKPFLGKENVRESTELSIKDRYLEMFPGYAKLILLTRFNLKHESYDVRYVNLDVGTRFHVLTDDFMLFSELEPESYRQRNQSMLEGLNRYKSLFSAASSLIYLPLLFIDDYLASKDESFKTKFSVIADQKFKKKVSDNFRKPIFKNERIVKCLKRHPKGDNIRKEIKPPEMQFKTNGFWRPLPYGQIGKDQDGNSIVGRTWVSRNESWESIATNDFLLTRKMDSPKGIDPGVIYVMRCPAHEKGIYKIGLTHRTSNERAIELSKTSAPLEFAVLAEYEVGNCKEVEKKIHDQLEAYRLNPKREYFKMDLREIISAIEHVISEK